MRDTYKNNREREVYLYLWDNANADGFVTASGGIIGKAIGMHHTAVNVYLHRLEAKCEVFRLEQDGGRGPSRFAVTAKVEPSE